MKWAKGQSGLDDSAVFLKELQSPKELVCGWSCAELVFEVQRE